jgi:hypothetical protein
MFRSAVVLAALFSAAAPATAIAKNPQHPGPIPIVDGSKTPGHSHETKGSCHSPTVVCVGKKVIGAAAEGPAALAGIGGSAVDAGARLGGGAGSLAGGAVIDGIVNWVAEGAASLLRQVAKRVDYSTRPALQSPWYRREYAMMAELGVGLTALFLLLAIGHSILQQQIAELLRAVLIALPLSLILSFAALTLVGLGLTLTDSMTTMVLSAAGAPITDAFEGIARLFVGQGSESLVPSFVVFITAIFAALLALVVWAELILREHSIYVAVAFLPLTFAAMIWRFTAVWSRRLLESLVAIVLSKFVLAVAFALAANALAHGADGAGSGGLSAIVGGCAVLLIAALAPWLLVRLIPFTGSAPDAAINRQHVGGAVRAVPGASTATGATRLLMYSRFASPAPAVGRTASAPAVAPAARRPDVPVAVIPPPAQERQGDRASD